MYDIRPGNGEGLFFQPGACVGLRLLESFAPSAIADATGLNTRLVWGSFYADSRYRNGYSSCLSCGRIAPKQMRIPSKNSNNSYRPITVVFRAATALRNSESNAFNESTKRKLKINQVRDSGDDDDDVLTSFPYSFYITSADSAILISIRPSVCPSV